MHCVDWMVRREAGGVNRTGVVGGSEGQLANVAHANVTMVVRRGEVHAVVAEAQRMRRVGKRQVHVAKGRCRVQGSFFISNYPCQGFDAYSTADAGLSRCSN